MSTRQRLDEALVARGLYPSRSRARDAVLRGTVKVDGERAAKPSQTVGPNTVLTIEDEAQGYVSRAALKLKHGLVQFGIVARGKNALDIGASTGGFTDCLLQHGAAHVVAVDVGRGQLHQKMLTHAAVTSLESQHISQLSPEDLHTHWGSEYRGLAQIVVTDVSFTSLAQLVPHIVALSSNAA